MQIMFSASKRLWSNHIGWADNGSPLRYAIPLLPTTGTLGCWFSPWPGSSLLSQPECHGLLHGTHIDGKLSADVPSTWAGPLRSRSQPQAIPQSDLTEAWLQKLPTFQSKVVRLKLSHTPPTSIRFGGTALSAHHSIDTKQSRRPRCQLPLIEAFAQRKIPTGRNVRFTLCDDYCSSYFDVRVSNQLGVTLMK